MSTMSTYSVRGMTCAHCVRAVTEEVSQVPGVVDVEVDLATGDLHVYAEGPLDPSAVAAAVDEAGYELAGVPTG
jgi:copper chaperone CopZ